MKLDILAIGAHPDDIELMCGGTLILHARMGLKTGIVDLTEGELGTRGTVESRKNEAEAAGKILGISARENLRLADGFFQPDKTSLLTVVVAIRKYQPEIIICNAITDRHPDHGRAASIVSTASFLAGLLKVETESEGKKQTRWKTKAIYHSLQDRYIKPDFVVDISDVWEQKMKAINAFKTQFFDPNSKDPETPISTPEFLDFLDARAVEVARPAGMKRAEGFTVERTPGVKSLFDLL